MKVRSLAFGLAWSFCLCAQHHFSWQEACFKNPRLPYCEGRDFAVRPAKPGKGSGAGTSNATSLSNENTIDAGGVDWRFADPAADAVAVLNCTMLSASPTAHSVIDQLGADRGLSPADVQNMFRALSGMHEVALSVHDDRIVLMAAGRPPDSVLPAPEAGWKATSLAGNMVLIGHADAVDRAALRLALANPLGELARMALDRQADSEFWAAGSAKLAGQAAVTAGVKRFSMTAFMHDGLASETAFEFDSVPEPGAIKAWLSTLGDAKIEGNMVYARTRQGLGQIAESLLGQRLAPLIQSARYLPVRDTAETKHTRPVIYGLDDGPKEVKQ